MSTFGHSESHVSLCWCMESWPDSERRHGFDRDLVELYRIIVDEEHHYLARHHTLATFYTGVITTLLGGSLIASTAGDLALLLPAVVSLAACGFALLARYVTATTYRRFLETVTYRAKIEQALGMTVPGRFVNAPKDERTVYWANEPLVYARHLEARRSTDDSKAFVTGQERLGHQRWTSALFFVLAALASIAASALFVLHLAA